MIEQLLTLSSEIRNELYGLLSESLPNRVRGAMIGVDTVALQSYLFDRGIYRYGMHPYEWQWLYSLRGFRFDIKEFEEFVRDYYAHHTKNIWDNHCKIMGYPEGSKPFYIKIILAIENDILRTGNLPAQFNSYPLIYEYRPPCITLGNTSIAFNNVRANVQDFFGSRSDLSVGRANPNTAGTLGGFLKDRNGRFYLVSCAHVLGLNTTEVYYPGPYEGRKSRKVGEVTFADLPDPLPLGIRYNPKTMPNAKKLDLAIAEITDMDKVSPSSIKLPTVQAVRSTDTMFLHDRVTFYGKTSGLTEAEISHLCIWYEMEINEQKHCFSDIFEIEHRRPWYFNTQLCKPGDSGSWVLYQTNEISAWDGMLFATDSGAHGFCCFAQHILEHPSLRLSPII